MSKTITEIYARYKSKLEAEIQNYERYRNAAGNEATGTCIASGKVEVLRDIVEDLEPLAYIPNSETVTVMQELENGGGEKMQPFVCDECDSCDIGTEKNNYNETFNQWLCCICKEKLNDE